MQCRLSLLPPNARDGATKSWIALHALSDAGLKAVEDYLKQSGTLIVELAHGARIYDVAGQNVCLSGGAPTAGMRRLTFYPEGWRVAGCQ